MNKNAIIASPPFSCGLGYIVDVFLALDIRTDFYNADPNIDGIHEYWEQTSDGYKLNKNGQTHLSDHSKIVTVKEKFLFSDNTSVLVEHAPRLLNVLGDQYKKNVLLVRDPIDAIFSWHRRYDTVKMGNALSQKGFYFDEYLSSVLYYNWHAPFNLFQQTPLTLYGLYYAFWLSVNPNTYIVKYEDLKSSVHELKNLLDYIEINRDQNSIKKAINLISESSSNSINYQIINPKGQKFEYLNRISEKEHDNILGKGSIISYVSRKLDYVNKSSDLDSNFFDNKVFYHTSPIFIELKIFLDQIQDAEKTVSVHGFIGMVSAKFMELLNNNFRHHICNGFTLNKDDVDFCSAFSLVTEFILELFKPNDTLQIMLLVNLIQRFSAFIANNMHDSSIRYSFMKKFVG